MMLTFSGVTGAGSYVFINQQQGSSISVYDGQNMRLLRSIPALEGPAGIAIDVENDWLAVSYPEQGMISFIDSRRLIPLEHIAVGGSPFGLAIAAGKLFYGDWNGGFAGVVDPADGRLLKKFRSANPRPDWLPSRKEIWCWCLTGKATVFRSSTRARCNA
nr:hypothetical protein [Methylomarinum sp. Ch1-1]MDP4521730.1 hypothetical protein [Methylomarinum sp. Ch1-1]